MNNRKLSAVLLPILTLGGVSTAFVACGEYPIEGFVAGDGPGLGTGGGEGGGELPQNTAPLPCAVLGDAGHKCVSAHSSVRVIVPEYEGPLYQLEKGGQTLDVGSIDGYADASAHEEFCGPVGCVISIVYDQSGYNNHLTPSPPGSANPSPGDPVPASSLRALINQRPVFGMKFTTEQGYRAACYSCPHPRPYPNVDVVPDGENGVPVGDEPQTQYMVTSQKDLINGCCFDYGNAEVTANNDGNGTMEAVYFGEGVIWGNGTGSELGPWVMADMENGLFPGWENGNFFNISTNTPLPHDFVTAVVVGDTQDKNGGKGRFAVYGGDATTPEIKEMYDGIRPEKLGYVPMQKQGSVILGIGGDNSAGAGGRFYEGVIALGAATAEVVSQLSAAIAEAKYETHASDVD